MRRLLSGLLIFILIIFSAYAVQYSVCSSGCDFATITSGLENVTGTSNTLILNESGTYSVTNITTFIIYDINDDGAVYINEEDITLDCNLINLTGNSSGYGIFIEDNNNITLRNCNIYNFSIGAYYENSSYSNLLNDSIGFCNYGIRLSQTDNTLIKDNLISNISTRAVQFTNTAINNTLWSSRIISSVSDIESSGENTSNTVLNSSFDNTKFNFNDNALLFVKWFFRAFVNDSNSNNVSGAVVNITDSFSSLIYSLTTDATGYTEEKNLSEYHQNSSGRTYYTNYSFLAYNSTKSASRSVNITGSGIVPLTFDLIPAVITISNPSNDTNLSYSTTWVNATIITDEFADCSYNLTDSSFDYVNEGAAMTDSVDGLVHWFNYTGLENGTSYTIYYKCNDSNSNINTGSAYHVFHVNQTPPESIPPVIALSNPTNDSNLSYNTTWTWVNITTDEAAYCKYNLTDSAFDFNTQGTLFTNTGSTNHSFNYSSLENGTTYPLYYKCNDSNGNINTESTYHVFYTDTAPDTTAPVVSNIANSTTNESILIAFDTDDSANFTLNYGISSALGTSTSNTTFSTYHTATLSSLVSETTYYFNITACNLEDYCAEYGTYSITTDETSDITAPAISSVSDSAITGESAIITWTTDELSDSIVEYGTTSGSYPSSESSTSDVTSHSITLSDLSEDTTYYYVVNSTDPSGNSAQSSEYSFTTPDETAPVISSVSSTSVGADSATITWTTDETADSQVLYGTVSGSYPYSESSSSFVTSHSIDITGLSDDTVYYFRVVSNDSSDNSRQSSQYSFSTTDGTAPTISFTTPINMSTSLTDSVNIQLTVTTNEAATCIADTYKIGSSATTADRTLTPANSNNRTHTAYFNATAESSDFNFYFTVTCTDASQNSGSKTSYFKVTDTTAPTGTFASPTPSNNAYTSNTSLLIKMQVNEPMASNYPKINFDDSATNSTMSLSNGYYTYSASSLEDGEHEFIIYLLDSYDNTRSYTRSFIVDNEEPEIDETYPEDDDEITNCHGVVLNVTLNEECECLFELEEHLEDEFDDCIADCEDDEDDCMDEADDDEDEEEQCEDDYDECEDACEEDEYELLEDGELEEVYGLDECEEECDEEYDDCVTECEDDEDTCMENADDNDEEDECEDDYDECEESCDEDQDDCNEECVTEGTFIYSEELEDTCFDDGEYRALFTCSDLASNEIEENVTFTVYDNEPPTITSTSPSGTISGDYTTIKVTTNEDAECRFSETQVAYASMDYPMIGTGTSHTFKYTGLEQKDYVFYALCNDSRGNVMTSHETISFTVDDSSSTTKSSKSFSTISSGSSATFEIDKEDISITGIILKVNTDVSDIKLDVEKVSDTTNLKTHSQPVYQYVQITKEGISNKEIDSVTIEFRVPLKWFVEEGLDENLVSLYKYTTSWEEVSTTKVSHDMTNVYYKAETNGLSLFAISVKDSASVTSTSTNSSTDSTSEAAVSSSEQEQEEAEKEAEEEEPTEISDEESSYLWLIILLCVLVVGGGSAGFYVYKSHRHPQQNSLAESQEQPTQQVVDEEEHSISGSALPPTSYPNDELAQYIMDCVNTGQGLDTIKKTLIDTGYPEQDIKAKFSEMQLTDELGDYINASLEAGQTPDDIKKALIDAGHGPQDIVNKFVDMGLLQDTQSMNDDILAYARECLENGLTPREIRKILIDAGHEAGLIDSLLQSIELEAYEVSDTPAEEPISTEAIEGISDTKNQSTEIVQDNSIIEKEIIDYVRESFKYGMTKDQISEQLINEGHDPDYIKVLTLHALKDIKKSKVKPEPEKKASKKKGFKKRHRQPDEVMSYIKNARNDKIPKRLIVSELLKAGHSKKDINKRFAEIEAVEKKLKKDLKDFVKAEKKAGKKKKEIKQELLDEGIDKNMIKKVL